MASRLSATEHAKNKLMEERRKNGELPPEQDADGNLINPHIPEFMAKAPWYLGQSEGPSLQHQKSRKAQAYDGISAVQPKGVVFQANKFRKGACKNCGSMTHKERDCTERPRKVGAWKSNKDVAPDEVVPDNMQLTFDGKRDRYNGYDPSEHALTVARFQAQEAERQRVKQQLREQKLLEEQKTEDAAAAAAASTASAEGGADGAGAAVAAGAPAPAKAKEHDGSDSDSDMDSSSSDDDDDMKLNDQDTGISNELMRFSTKAKMTVRNLRLREDLPKYLRNLDPNSALYDPKTRAMRENPNPEADPSETGYAGDNATRISGDAIDFAKTQVFAFEAEKAGQNIILEAAPTQAALLRKQYEQKQAELVSSRKASILKKYGGQEEIVPLPKELRLGVNEGFVQYGRDGRVVGAPERATYKSKYEEDVFVNNHTTVWGSWYNRATHEWGYACCHVCFRNSICLAKNASAAGAPPAAPAVTSPTAAAASAGGSAADDDAWRHRNYQRERQPKRHYSSMHAEPEMDDTKLDEYQRKKARSDDPMAGML